MSNDAAIFTYDQTPKGGDKVTEDKSDEAIAVGSVEWYMSLYVDEKPSAPDTPVEEHSSDMDTNNQDWNFDSYFTGSTRKSPATLVTISLTSVLSIVIGIVATISFTC